MLAAAKVGIDKKNEIFAESYLLKPNNLPEEIVIPDLLTPGISANTWNKPMIIADLLENSLSIFFVSLILSLRYNNIPKTRLIHPMIFKFLNCSINPVL